MLTAFGALEKKANARVLTFIAVEVVVFDLANQAVLKFIILHPSIVPKKNPAFARGE
jgi:hypothetical protein